VTVADYYDNVRDDVIAVLPAQLGSVLDVGCGNGATGATILDQRRASVVDGIELDQAAAAAARHRYRHVWTVDLDGGDAVTWIRKNLPQGYNTIMCNDVLEHVRDPWVLLEALVTRLGRGGQLVVSLPNVQCVEAVGPLLLGRFQYRDSGVLDRTHLRFFTRQTGRQLIEQAGLEVAAEAVQRVGQSRPLVTRKLLQALGPFSVRQMIYLARWPKARPASGPADSPPPSG